MVRVIDLDTAPWTVDELFDAVQRGPIAILRRAGKVVVRLDAADEIDLDDELGSQAPEQLKRGMAARAR